jgi:nucleoside-diphosphate-sugar epimerase
MDAIISSVGITRQKDGLTYDVDYGGNRNLLERALAEGVSKFIYVSVINAHKVTNLKVIRAK